MFNKTPAKGMRDILPSELALRERVQKVIIDNYTAFGYNRIETPCVEDLALLTGKQGGENEKLIFKILKRGEKLDKGGELCDLGLRFDLTMPLTRFYANNQAKLPSVFKAMQIGSVWRADRPQRGRFRQFVQCDIDIIGEESILAEIDLVCATSKTVADLGFGDAVIKINDRCVLKGAATYAGFTDEQCESVYIALDKLDKIGADGVKKELVENGCEREKAEKLIEFTEKIKGSENSLETCLELLCDFISADTAQRMRELFTTLSGLASVKTEFDITLVRGMNYYTGTIFEIWTEGEGFALGGGGRYDELLGKFTGRDTPACGFSIGFERIVTVLTDRGVNAVNDGEGVALLIEKGAESDVVREAFKRAEQYRRQGRKCSVCRKNKNFKLQEEQLRQNGYTEIIIIRSE